MEMQARQILLMDVMDVVLGWAEVEDVVVEGLG